MHFCKSSVTSLCDGLVCIAAITVSNLSPLVMNLMVSSPDLTLTSPYSVVLLNTTADTASSLSPTFTKPDLKALPFAAGCNGARAGC